MEAAEEIDLQVKNNNAKLHKTFLIPQSNPETDTTLPEVKRKHQLVIGHMASFRRDGKTRSRGKITCYRQKLLQLLRGVKNKAVC